MSKKGIMTLLGFLLFLFGVISIVLALVGLKISALNIIYLFGPGIALLIQLIMIFGGIILVYLANFDPEED